MKQIILFLMLTGLQVLPGSISGQPGESDHRLVTIGACQANITPVEPIPLSGYDARKGPFTGIHDSLYAAAIFIRDDKNPLLLITADLIGYNSRFIEETGKLISEKIGLPVQNIMITAVHNHGGPVTRTYETDVPRAVDRYIKNLQDKFVKLAFEASAKTIPFRMGIGKGNCYMNINRRAEFADGGIWLGRDQQRPCDHEIDIIRFTGYDGKIIAFMVNWACHGTASGQENTMITGDWPGAAARYIKKHFGPDIPVLVTAGASGDINPIYGPGNDFNEIETVGYEAGKTAVQALQNIVMDSVVSFNVRDKIMVLPGKKVLKDQFPVKEYEKGPNVEIRLTLFRIGHLVLAGISGEVMNEIGTDIKKQSPFTNTIIITHCNGSSGYICTDKAFTEGGYEVKVTHLMPGTEIPLRTEILRLISDL